MGSFCSKVLHTWVMVVRSAFREKGNRIKSLEHSTIEICVKVISLYSFATLPPQERIFAFVPAVSAWASTA